MKIKVTCLCGKSLLAEARYAGLTSACPYCGSPVDVPELPDSEVDEANQSTVLMPSLAGSTRRPRLRGPGEAAEHFIRTITGEESRILSASEADARSLTDSERGLIVRDRPGRERDLIRLFRRIAGVVAAITWALTIRSPAWTIAVVNYSALALAVSFVAAEIVEKRPGIGRAAIPIILLCAIFACAIWNHFDWYEVNWTADIGAKNTDRTWRSGRAFQRVALFEMKTGPHRGVGKLAGDPPMPHGYWKVENMQSHVSTDIWFWFGENTTQGEWELRNKR